MRNDVALFVTCLVDLLRPEIGFAAVRLLRQSGADLVIPEPQTCCGQPAYNGGDPEKAKQLAKKNITLLEAYKAIIVPSASCAGMIKRHYPELLSNEADWFQRATNMAGNIFELSQYLQGKIAFPLKTAKNICHHDSCSALREMQAVKAPRELLAAKTGSLPKEPLDPYACCGFGGAFSVKFPGISHKMAEEKLRALKNSGADLISSCDLGCLMHLEGTAQKMGLSLRFSHIAEILADDRSQ